MKSITIFIDIALSIIFTYFIEAYHNILNNYANELNTSLTFLITLFGFLLTSLSILIGLSDREFIKALKESGHYRTFLQNFIYCIVLAWISILINMLLIFLPRFNSKILLLALIFFFILLNLFLISLGLKMWAIIKRI